MYRIEKRIGGQIYVTIALFDGRCYCKHLKAIKTTVKPHDLICNWGRVESWNFKETIITEWIEKRKEDGFRLQIFPVNEVYEKRLEIPWSNTTLVTNRYSISLRGKLNHKGRPSKKEITEYLIKNWRKI